MANVLMEPNLDALIKRLKEADISLDRFLKVNESKAAFEKDWDEHLYDPSELDQYSSWGVCGKEGLVLVDADNQEMANIIEKILPATFTVKSPRRQLPHFYYKVVGGVMPNKHLKINKTDKEGYGEIRAQNQYLVAPGTKIEYNDLVTGEKKNGVYEVIEDIPIAKILFEDFFEAIKPYLGTKSSQKLEPTDIKEGVGAGTRHEKAMKHAAYLVRYVGLDNETVLSHLIEWDKKNNPPINDIPYFKRTINQAIEYELRDRGPLKENNQQNSQVIDKSLDAKNDPPPCFFDEKGKLDCGRLSTHININDHFITPIDRGGSAPIDIYIYEDGIYYRNGIAAIEKKCESLLDGQATNKAVTEVLGHIRRRTQIMRDVIDQDITKIVVKNGILDIMTLELKSHSPKHISLQKIPVVFDPGADCPAIKKFLDDVLDKEDIEVFQEIIGYCLSKQYKLNRAFMFFGSGANGKTVCNNLIAAFLGVDNIATPTLQELIEDRFARAELYGRLANINSEVTDETLKNTGVLKTLTGNEIKVRAQFKNRNAFDFYNYAKLIYSANELPITNDHTDAFWRRWILIPFANKFVEKDEGTDPDIIEKLTTPEELSGLLNFALEGLARVMVNKGFTTTPNTEKTKETWIAQSDSVMFFINSCVEENTVYCIEKSDCYNAYKEFCEEEHTDVKDQKQLTNQLKRLPTVNTEYRPRGSKGRPRFYRGIKLTEFNITSMAGDRNRKIDKKGDLDEFIS